MDVEVLEDSPVTRLKELFFASTAIWTVSHVRAVAFASFFYWMWQMLMATFIRDAKVP